ncbi:MAG: YbaB/EbfC family nucleoid-associated protein [Acetobacteraceae bacterium]|nr:YbaB/EbfC family nucleoid-associated protein [Acetobacteraceae bacterium]
MGIGDLGRALKQVQKLQAEVARLQDELERRLTEATAGGGAVRVVVRGGRTLESIELQPEVVDPRDIGLLQDLILAAVNQALARAHEEAQAELAKITGGLKIPGLPE